MVIWSSIRLLADENLVIHFVCLFGVLGLAEEELDISSVIDKQDM